MADNQDKLKELLGDQERLGQVLELAQMLRGHGSAAKEAAPAIGPDAPVATPLSTSEILGAVAGGAVSSAEPAPLPGGFSAIAEILPPLLQALSGSGDSLPPEKVNLVRAIKPYAASHTDSIDRAIKMANIAKAAKSALSALGRR